MEYHSNGSLHINSGYANTFETLMNRDKSNSVYENSFIPLKRPSKRLDKLRLTSTLADLHCYHFYRAIVGELLGTFMLVFFGCSMATSKPDVGMPELTVVRISLSNGFTVATLIWSLAGVSGAHVNPAVTLGFWITRRISLIRTILYIIVQCGAAIAGACLVQLITYEEANPNLGMILPNRTITIWQAFVAEFFITFNLLFLVLACLDAGRHDVSGSVPLTVGVCVIMNCLAFVPISGGAMNPARTLGPAVMKGNMSFQWMYWCADCLGGIVGAILYDQFFSSNASVPRFWAYLTNVSSEYDPDKIYNQSSKIPTVHTDTESVSMIQRS